MPGTQNNLICVEVTYLNADQKNTIRRLTCPKEWKTFPETELYALLAIKLGGVHKIKSVKYYAETT